MARRRPWVFRHPEAREDELSAGRPAARPPSRPLEDLATSRARTPETQERIITAGTRNSSSAGRPDLPYNYPVRHLYGLRR
jgi:hypothetical protein